MCTASDGRPGRIFEAPESLAAAYDFFDRFLKL